MADATILPAVPQLSQAVDFSNAGVAANNAVYVYAVTSIVIMVLIGLGTIIFLHLYKRTFNIGVTVLDNTKGGIIIRDGYLGKYIQTRPGEFRFKIFDAKKFKFRYNQESLNPEDFYFQVLQNGKVKRRVFMSFDSEGQLIPAKFNAMTMSVPKLDSRGYPLYNQDGKPLTEQRAFISATVKQVDVAWYYKELDKKSEVFDARSMFDKWGWIFLMGALILTLGAFMYVAHKFGLAASGMQEVTGHMARIVTFMQQNSTVVVAN